MQDQLFKKRCIPYGRCLVPVIWDYHQNKDILLSEELPYISPPFQIRRWHISQALYLILSLSSAPRLGVSPRENLLKVFCVMYMKEVVKKADRLITLLWVRASSLIDFLHIFLGRLFYLFPMSVKEVLSSFSLIIFDR